MNLEGRVLIDLPRAAGSPVRVEFARPGDICAILRGRTAAEVLSLIPAVYSICATAQSHAAVSALEQASGIAVSPMTKDARKALTGMETLREHLLRIALDWPGFLFERPRGANVRQAMAMVPSLKEALFGTPAAFELGREATPNAAEALKVIAEAETLLVEEVFAEPLEHWLERAAAGEIEAWAGSAKTVAARLFDSILQDGSVRSGETSMATVPLPSANGIRVWLQQKDPNQLPIADSPAKFVPETTLYSRRANDPVVAALKGSGLGPRFVARLVELARLPDELRSLINNDDNQVRPAPAGDGFGWSAIEAARGLLIHAVELRDGCIADYRVLPPTRWNFDADGVAKRCLSELDFSANNSCDELLRQANLIVNAIDPCVAHEVRVN